MNMKSKSFESAVFFYLLSQQVLVISNHHKEKKRKSLYGQNIYTSFFGKFLKLIIECYFLRLKKWNDLIKSINSVKWHVYAFSDTECVFWLISNGKVPKPWQDPKHQWQIWQQITNHPNWIYEIDPCWNQIHRWIIPPRTF